MTEKIPRNQNTFAKLSIRVLIPELRQYTMFRTQMNMTMWQNAMSVRATEAFKAFETRVPGIGIRSLNFAGT